MKSRMDVIALITDGIVLQYKKTHQPLLSWKAHIKELDMCEGYGRSLKSAFLQNKIIDIGQSPIHSCFFIVQHIEDLEYIGELASKLISADCREFVFFGAKEPIWHLEFDETDTRLKGDITVENVALTSGCDTLDEFVEELDLAIYFNSGSEQTLCLFYDDMALYEQAVELLAELDKNIYS